MSWFYDNLVSQISNQVKKTESFSWYMDNEDVKPLQRRGKIAVT